MSVQGRPSSAVRCLQPLLWPKEQRSRNQEQRSRNQEKRSRNQEKRNRNQEKRST
jgi:hypothetical protein